MKRLILPALLLLNACTPNIIDRDFEEEEAEYIRKYKSFAEKDPLWQNPTPDNMFLTKVDDVSVTIHKMRPDDDEGIMLQNWSVIVVNHNDTAKCVNIAWKLQGFKMVSDYPGFRLIQPKESILDYVKLKQTIWSMDGIKFALPPSGYIEQMEVNDPNESPDVENEICDFYELDDDIVEM